MLVRCSSSAAALALLVLPLAAQCANPWQPSYSVAGVVGTVRTITTWDPDGTGPATPVWVVGGEISFAGTVPAAGIATFDPATGAWAQLGNGLSGGVYALAVLANGELVAGGDFTTSGGVTLNHVARWNGSTWTAIGNGFDSGVRSLCQRPNGDLVAGGLFTSSGGVATVGIAQWNGTSWAPLGLGPGATFSLANLPNGNLAAGLLATGPSPAVRTWNGVTWSTLGNPAASGLTAVSRLLVTPNGSLVAFGLNLHGFYGSATPANLALWNGTAWSALAAPPNSVAVGATLTANGTLVAAMHALGTTANILAWNGSAWIPYASPIPDAPAIAMHALANGELLAGGALSAASFRGFAHWDGTAWQGTGTTSPQYQPVLAGAADGSIYAAWFDNGLPAPNHLVARFDGSSWQNLGAADGPIHALTTTAAGDLIVGGFFTTIGGVPADRVARWNGTAWSTIGNAAFAGPSTPGIYSLLARTNGELVVSGTFAAVNGTPCAGIARFDGTTWSPLGAGLLGYATQMLALANGGLIAVGTFQHDGNLQWLGYIGRWNGTAWSGFGLGFNGAAQSITARPNGTLVVGGSFTQAGGFPALGLASWNGTWTPLGAVPSGYVSQVRTLPNGNIVAAGYFNDVGGVPAMNIARWNGSTWSPFGAGTDGAVTAMATAANGDLLVGGTFTTVDGLPSPHFARITTTCPATTTVTGSSCGGAVLTPMSLPWLGTAFQARATGLPANSIAVHVLGVAPVNVPLPLILSQSLPGCTLVAQPDLLLMGLPVGGTLDVLFPLSTSLAWVGFTVEQQVVALGLNAQGDIATAVATNGLHLVEGHF